MNRISSSDRLKHGHFIEDQFQKVIHNQKGWTVKEKGQRRLSDAEQLRDRQTFIDINSEFGKSLIQQLPPTWQHPYVKRLELEGIPCANRFVPDFECHYKEQFCFDAEIKSEMTNRPNITFELSGYLWAKKQQQLTKTEKVFIFAVQNQSIEWFYLMLNQLPEKTTKIFSGENCGGSGRPFGIIPKASLNQKLEHLFWYFETLEF